MPRRGLHCRRASHKVVADPALLLGCWILQSKSTQHSSRKVADNCSDSLCNLSLSSRETIHKYSFTRVLDPQDASGRSLSEGFPRAPFRSARFFLEASIPKDGTHPSGAGPDRRDRSGEREITRPWTPGAPFPSNLDVRSERGKSAVLSSCELATKVGFNVRLVALTIQLYNKID